MTTAPERFVCIHGHFYQPPRENPWLEAIEPQDSAYPYHDWNDRITAECYARNAAARILDDQGRIESIVNNYGRISYNFGPTLLQWLDDFAPEVYRTIIEADRESQQRYGGHGSAIAQAYNHVILPLANSRDKRTQILWGIRDFEHRFGRAPEGMWLPETAVDLESLSMMVEQGIRFTILAPNQARRVRGIGGRGAWRDVTGGQIDPKQPYLVRLPTGRAITVFFYDGPVAHGVAFEGLLERGELLADRLLGVLSEDGSAGLPQLAHIATDGETYGHHHRHGEMALAYALHHIELGEQATLTNYAQYLERFQPLQQVEIFENTAWSCAHGVERWRSDCGCNTSGPSLHQKWRAPLREAFDWLRDRTAGPFEEAAAACLREPWAARDDYVNVILDREPESVQAFFQRQASHELSDTEKTQVLKLMELQRHAMLMYTSCGWFFDEISGIEAMQVLQYAGRTVQLAQDLFGDSIEEQFAQRLEAAPSNRPEMGNGRQIYERFVVPARIDLRRVAAHYAVSSVFQPYLEDARVYCYQVTRSEHRRAEAGHLTLATGRIRVRSGITQDADEFSFAVLHLGDHNLTAGVLPFREDTADPQMEAELFEAFDRADVPEAIRLIDRHFQGSTYSLEALFPDEQRRILDGLLASSLQEAETNYRQVYEHQTALMHHFKDLGAPIPRSFQMATEYALNAAVRSVLSEDRPGRDRLQAIMQEVQTWGVQLDAPVLAFAYNRAIEAMARDLRENPLDLDLLGRLDAMVGLKELLPFEVELWTSQNACYRLLIDVYPALSEQAAGGDEGARAWVEQFRQLADRLSIRVD